MTTPTLIMMVGISSSGKSTRAKELINKYAPAIIISSDDLREELYGDRFNQTHNDEVFAELNRRVKKEILDGNNVIVDAMNITMKSRRGILDNVKDLCCWKMAYIMATRPTVCFRRNGYRNNPLEEKILSFMIARFQIPFYEEGFDYIKIYHETEFERENLLWAIEEMKGFNQCNPHHRKDLLTHALAVTTSDGAMTPYKLGSFLHDIGKVYTQSFDKEGVAHYYSHEGVGTYHLLSWYDLGLSDNDLLETLFIVNYHMLPFSWTCQKTRNKYKRIFGEKKYKQLLDFHEKDIRR